MTGVDVCHRVTTEARVDGYLWSGLLPEAQWHKCGRADSAPLQPPHGPPQLTASDVDASRERLSSFGGLAPRNLTMLQ